MEARIVRRGILSLVVGGVLLFVLPTPGQGARTYRCHGKAATYVGTPGPDRVRRDFDTPEDYGDNPVLVMRGGNDRVHFSVLGDEQVTICAGGGRDLVSLSEGGGTNRPVFVDGGRGPDTLDTEGSTDQLQLPSMTLKGRGGADRLFAANASDRLLGGAGDDFLYAEFGDDKLRGGNGDDRLYGLGDDDRLFGARGDDLLDGGGGETFSGGFDRADGGPDRDRCLAERTTRCEAGR